MVEAWVNPALLNGVGVVGVVVLVGFLIWRGYLIPRPLHREVVEQHKSNAEKAEGRAERWEGVALKALLATEKLAQPVETAAKVLTKLPSPVQDGAEA